MNNSYKQSYNVNKIEQDRKFDEEIRKASEVPSDEKTWGSMLNEAGRKAYFEEYFNGVKVENQEIGSIGPFANPRTTVSFKNGYARGEFLVKVGIVPSQYQTEENNSKTR